MSSANGSLVIAKEKRKRNRPIHFMQSPHCCFTLEKKSITLNKSSTFSEALLPYVTVERHINGASVAPTQTVRAFIVISICYSPSFSVFPCPTRNTILTAATYDCEVRRFYSRVTNTEGVSEQNAEVNIMT